MSQAGLNVAAAYRGRRPSVATKPLRSVTIPRGTAPASESGRYQGTTKARQRHDTGTTRAPTYWFQKGAHYGSCFHGGCQAEVEG